MYGGSGKLNRGGGGPIKRNIHSAFQPSSVQRRQSGHRNPSSNNTPTESNSASTTEETFSLVRNNVLNFGMLIRLSPVLVEEIKRFEADGGVARIKFDSSANNTNGNVIYVGGKEFRFTWSQETGHLCDIYEERRSGDGDGLLVESGSAWRKLNVQRELDDSVKNHVKMRTVEAERKHKSRTAIVLDPNPSMKNQLKAAAEVNNAWRGSYKQKKDLPFRKMKAETSSVIPPKPGGKPGFSSSTPSKIRASSSPLLSAPDQSGVPLSPPRSNNLNKLHTNRDDATLTQSSKENASTFEREMFNRVPAGIVQNKPGSNERFGNQPTDLQSLLVSLLMDKPQGMNLKALERAVGETTPKSVKRIEPILKRIAVFQDPGKYVLKPDFESESFRKSLSESGSSPENNNHFRVTTAPESSFPSRADEVKEFEEPSHQISEPYEDLNILGKNDTDNLSPYVFSDKKVSHNKEDPAVSSSRSGSDSDSESDSSDSGSDSKSPVGSSSDSDSDASLNSKQGSDEDVDIMSDDDKEPKQNLQPLDHGLGYEPHNMPDEKDDGHDSDLLDLEKDLFGDNHKAQDNYAGDTTNHFIDHLHYDQVHEVHDPAKRVVSRTTSKRGSDEKNFDENENVKRLKSRNQAWSNSRSIDGPRTLGRTVDDMSDYDYENINNRDFFGNSTSDFPRSDPRQIDLNAQAHPPDDLDDIVGFSERGPQGSDVFFMQKDNSVNKETRDEDSHPKDRRPPKNSGGKPSGSHQKKYGGLIGKNKELELPSTSQIKNLPVDLKKPTVINGRGPALQRELSDLEIGELREHWHEENRFGRNNSFKQSEAKSSSDYWNLDESKIKPNDMSNIPNKVVSEDHVDDFTRFNGKPSLSKPDNLKSGSQNNKGRHSEAGASRGTAIGFEGYTINTESQIKGHVDVPHKHEKQGIPISTKDKRKHKSKDLGEKKRDSWMVNSRNKNETKRREMESCSDDSIASYMKYEKDEPEMKEPIRDLSQYNEYVQEYHEKYDCYHTLNKILESYRNEFQNFRRDLELAKGKDIERYNKILEQLMESYRQCGMKHRRLKKIFVVLHHELQHLKEMIRDFVEKQTKG